MKRRHIVIILLSLLAFMLVVISSCTKSPSRSEIKRVIGEYMKKEPIPDWFCSQETIDAERKTLPKDVMVAEYKGAKHLIIGTGQSGALKLSDKAEKYFKEKGCSVELFPTPQAIDAWNKAKGKTIGMFHVTC